MNSGRRNGFSLLEVLVAFSILALSLGVLMQIFSGSLRNVERARDQAQATTLAQSLLASAGVEAELAAGGSSGDIDGRFRWRVNASPFRKAMPSGEATRPMGIDLWEVTAEVAWGGDAGHPEHTLRLSSLRVQSRATQ